MEFDRISPLRKKHLISYFELEGLFFRVQCQILYRKSPIIAPVNNSRSISVRAMPNRLAGAAGAVALCLLFAGVYVHHHGKSELFQVGRCSNKGCQREMLLFLHLITFFRPLTHARIHYLSFFRQNEPAANFELFILIPSLLASFKSFLKDQG